MPLKTKALLILLIILIFQFIGPDFSYAKKDYNLFDKIIEAIGANVTEYGVKIDLETEKDGENSCLEILKELNLEDSKQIMVYKNGDVYCIEFSENNLKGYIENIIYDNHNVVTINIVEFNNKNELEKLKNDLEKNIDKEFKRIKIAQYLKAQINNSDLSEVNNGILKILKRQHAGNINYVKLTNGFSGVALTGLYSPMKDGERLIDFNYAVCGYTNDKYLIIGTPTITITY